MVTRKIKYQYITSLCNESHVFHKLYSNVGCQVSLEVLLRS